MVAKDVPTRYRLGCVNYATLSQNCITTPFRKKSTFVL